MSYRYGKSSENGQTILSRIELWLDLKFTHKSLYYCKRTNVHGGFNFAMFAVEDFSAKLKPPKSFYKFDNTWG